MWIEICLTIICVIKLFNTFMYLVRFHKDYQEEEEDKEMSEAFKRMFV
jgi:uncharacterized membrane protein